MADPERFCYSVKYRTDSAIHQQCDPGRLSGCSKAMKNVAEAGLVHFCMNQLKSLSTQNFGFGAESHFNFLSKVTTFSWHIRSCPSIQFMARFYSNNPGSWVEIVTEVGETLEEKSRKNVSEFEQNYPHEIVFLKLNTTHKLPNMEEVSSSLIIWIQANDTINKVFETEFSFRTSVQYEEQGL